MTEALAFSLLKKSDLKKFKKDMIIAVGIMLVVVILVLPFTFKLISLI